MAVYMYTIRWTETELHMSKYKYKFTECWDFIVRIFRAGNEKFAKQYV